MSLTCPFRHGWRLEPAALHQLDQVDGDHTVYAIPLNPDTTLNLEHAVLWPSILASAGRVLLGTERQAA